MSKITGSEVKGLLEAYAAVYAPQELTEEQIWEEVENWVNSLLEEGYDLSDYTWEEMYEAYLSEKMSADPYGVSPGTPRISGGRGPNLKKFFGFDSPAKPGQGRTNVDPYGVSPRSPSRPSPAATRPAAAAPTPSKPTPTAPARPSGGVRPAAPARPSGGVRPAAPARPVATQTGDKAKDMATWAKANPKLAAASAERERTRGTSATTNPLMADLKSRLPAPKPAATPTPPVKAVTPTAAVSAAPSTSSAASGSVAPATAKIAAKPSPAMAADATRRARLNMEMEYDAYDIVLEYLLSQGHADTVDEALYVMMEMDAETIQDIVEVHAPPPIMSPPPVKAPPTPTKDKKKPEVTGDGSGKPMDGPYKD